MPKGRLAQWYCQAIVLPNGTPPKHSGYLPARRDVRAEALSVTSSPRLVKVKDPSELKQLATKVAMC
jgi:hypothetical protein